MRRTRSRRCPGRCSTCSDGRRSRWLSPVLCDRLEANGQAELLDALGEHARWTSAATHAVLPLLASDALIADGGVSVCAFEAGRVDPRWLAAVIDEAAGQGLRLTDLDDALERHEPVAPAGPLGVTSWCEGADLRTWSGPAAAELAWQVRRPSSTCCRSGADRPTRRCASCWACSTATG